MAGVSPSENSTDMRNHGSVLHFTKIQNEKYTSFHKSACRELDKILVEITSTGRKHSQFLPVPARCSPQPQKHQEYYKSRQYEEVIFKMCLLKG